MREVPRSAGITSVVIVVVEEGPTPPVLVVIPSVAPSAATAVGWCDCLAIRGPEGVGEQREIRVGQREKGHLQLHPAATATVDGAVEMAAEREDNKDDGDADKRLFALGVDVLDLLPAEAVPAEVRAAEHLQA